ncbi:MAG TPA: N-acetylmuramoyl-L-alanine amidase [Solirubrobacteraceae bacterium]|nr:N-acetylmuramoyl-L-alanine amidase [Solirubrobacteraceae bacterium]
MTARELTRRSLLAVAAGAAAGGLLRPRAALAGARPVAVPSDGAAGRYAHDGALELATPTLPAGGGQPPIIAREAWALGRCTPRVAPEYGSVQLAFVHHTENPNGYAANEVPAMLRSIYQFHRYTNGWNDIGYNFVIDRFGRIFEARAGGIDEPVTGAQAGGYNYCSTGIAVLGEYGGVRISPAARDALVRLLAWKLALHGTPIEGRVTVRVNPAGAGYSRFPANARVSLPRVAGHRDADSTECPGNAFYDELPGVRLSAAHTQGTPARLTLALTPLTTATAPVATPPAPTPAPGATSEASPASAPAPTPVATLGGSLAFLGAGGVDGHSGAPIAGAPLTIQIRSVSRRGEVVLERALAQTQTAADGSWSLPLYSATPGVPALAPGTWLRALCPGATGVPAAVAAAVRLTGALSFSAPSAPAQG